MTTEEYIKLYEKFNSGQCTPEEEARLMEFQDDFKFPETSHDLPLNAANKQKRSVLYARINKTLVTKRAGRSFRTMWGWAAAAAVALLFSAILIFQEKQPGNTIAANVVKKPAAKPIKPGRNTAILTLANGTSITLDDAKNGVIAKSGKSSVKKLANGLIAYSEDGLAQPAGEPAKNIVTVPRGGKYTVQLPDGTMVWLNSSSSLSYPVAFAGANRSVTLTGEAYFEVTKNKHLPFIVHTNGVDVKVLGTHFNVSAYEDEKDIKTTLIEGSVSLSNNKSSALLVPGQQGVTGTDQGIITKPVNVNQVIAWKTGYFIFRDDDIRGIMKKISRWYDVEVEYQGNVTHRTFGGIYSMNKDINELLKGLELTGLIHFKIEERRIIVMN
ncbi:FecR domain-containing protein [Mucilaginibacter sp. SMC90]|uniref:FecR family protein n=1 Tax=Mucilaginibacter sp. SMC90 TaxID=2929803 RepID=UPI001FB56D8E|nr:FecR family protein [Mucilaginibacter sp. SMC90]UOE46304.1 FecR domain-containing protein [Mucilaginibacter sp. SMC90]